MIIDELTCVQRCQDFMAARLPSATSQPHRLHQAMRYAALNPGKRLRPQCVYFTGVMLNVDLIALDHIAAAVECIHAYSLIHDDLPAMDDDDLRRGLPTCHREFDEATAILAGDALQSFAFRLLCEIPTDVVIQAKQSQLVKMLGQATGSEGMAGGQMFDILSASEIKNEADLSQLHKMKTGALIHASILMPAQLSEKLTKEKRQHLDDFAWQVGLGFQIQDDILDVTSAAETTGKTSGSDARHNKLTYPELLGLEGAIARRDECLARCLASLEALEEDSRALVDMAHRMIHREK